MFELKERELALREREIAAKEMGIVRAQSMSARRARLQQCRSEKIALNPAMRRLATSYSSRPGGGHAESCRARPEHPRPRSRDASRRARRLPGDTTPTTPTFQRAQTSERTKRIETLRMD